VLDEVRRQRGGELTSEKGLSNQGKARSFRVPTKKRGKEGRDRPKYPCRGISVRIRAKMEGKGEAKKKMGFGTRNGQAQDPLSLLLRWTRHTLR